MLKNIRIENFRCFRDLKIDRFERVNLIAGGNNAGKTALLEALYFLLGDFTKDVVNHLPTLFRSLPSNAAVDQNFWKWIYAQESQVQEILFEGHLSNLSEFRVRLVPSGSKAKPSSPYEVTTTAGNYQVSYSPKGLLAALPKCMVTALRTRDPSKSAVEYEKVLEKGEAERKVEDLMRRIEPRVKRIRPLRTTGIPLIHIDIGLPETIPVTQMGQGVARALGLFAGMIITEAKLLIVDEIEDGIYYANLPVVWEAVRALAEELDVQVFATTHSLECIEAAHRVFSEGDRYDFALHRLQRVNDVVECVTYSQEELEVSLKTGLETR